MSSAQVGEYSYSPPKRSVCELRSKLPDGWSANRKLSLTAARQIVEYTWERFLFEPNQQNSQRLCVGIDFAFTRAKGAAQEAHFGPYRCLLPPRKTAKLFEANGMVGRGGGDRTRPPISKSRDLMALQPPTNFNC